ncbi:MAG: hypothetical protein ABI240_05250 [Sphingomonas sp.]
MSMLRKIELYLKKTAMPPTRFGRLAVNDPRLVGDLKNGREPGSRIVARVEAFLARGPENRPEKQAGKKGPNTQGSNTQGWAK